MDIKKIFSGPCDNNIYVVGDEKKAVLIDASASIEEIEQELNGRKLVAIFITHGHYDHIANIDEIVKHFNVKAYLTKEAFKKLNDANLNCSGVFGVNYKTSLDETDFVFIENGESLDFIKDNPILVYQTKGHTDCGVCLKFGENILFSGDTIFYGTYGRTDLPTGDSEKMEKTLDFIHKTFAGFNVYPGHGRSFEL